ncbi:hypothetical protein [Peptostreptococcus porci]|nr:hypothetical protein [Peptostreptococcus porci]MDY6231099.1 hypothetical protein [Peptostreptococcus porci]
MVNRLLKVVGNNQRYDFRSQLGIYDRNTNVPFVTLFIPFITD